MYTITPKGKARFEELMRKTAALPSQGECEFLVVTANLRLLDKEPGKGPLKEH